MCLGRVIGAGRACAKNFALSWVQEPLKGTGVRTTATIVTRGWACVNGRFRFAWL